VTAIERCRLFVDEWPDAEFGPAHIVLADYNLEDHHLRWCLGLCRAALSHDERDLLTPYEVGTFIDPHTRTTYAKPAGDRLFMDRMDWYRRCDRDELAATIGLLEQLLTLPEAQRVAESNLDDAEPPVDPAAPR